MHNRPLNFRLNRYSSLAEGLVFAGLGGWNCVGSAIFADSSHYGNHGTLTNMDPATDWVWSSELGRWCLDFNGTDNRVAIPSIIVASNSTFTVAILANFTGSDAAYRSLLGTTGATDNHFSLYGSLGRQYAAGEDGAVKLYDWGDAADVQGWHLWSFRRFSDGSSLFGRDRTYNAVASLDAVTWSKVDSIGGGRGFFVGAISDVMIWNYPVASALLDDLSYPSNVTLSGLILPPTRRFWPVAVSGGETPDLLLPHHGMMGV